MSIANFPTRTDIVYGSSKAYLNSIGLSSVFRNWRDTGHCRLFHGYSLGFKLEFETSQLDERGWVVDFGGMKSLKGWLEDWFDHRLLVAQDDPMYKQITAMADIGLFEMRTVPAVGCEAFARFVFEYAEQWAIDNGFSPRVKLSKVTCNEHEANSAWVRVR